MLSGLILKIFNAPGGIQTHIAFFVRKVLYSFKLQGH